MPSKTSPARSVPASETEAKAPVSTTVQPFVERALKHHRGPASLSGMTRFVLTEWAKKNPAPQDAAYVSTLTS